MAAGASCDSDDITLSHLLSFKTLPSQTIGTKPIAHIDHFTPEMLGTAELAEEVSLDGSGKLIKVRALTVAPGGSLCGPWLTFIRRSLQITGCASPGKTVSIVVRGSNKLVIEEAERSIHDALCVIRCLVKKRWVASGAEQRAWPLTKALLHWLLLQERNKQRNSDV